MKRHRQAPVPYPCTRAFVREMGCGHFFVCSKRPQEARPRRQAEHPDPAAIGGYRQNGTA